MTNVQAAGPRSSEKLFGALGVKIRLAIISSLVLLVGAMVAPRPSPTALSAPQEHAAPLLEEQVQSRDVAQAFRGVQEVASSVREHSVAIAPFEERTLPTLNDFFEPMGGSEAAGFGVFVSESEVLTHAGALGGRSSVRLMTPDGRVLDARVASYERATGLVLLRTAASGRPAVDLAASPPELGALAVGVGRWNGRNLAVPVFVTGVGAGAFQIGAIGQSVPAGMPVYSLDGELFAIAGGQEGRAYPVVDAAKRLTARAAAGQWRPSLGLAFQDLTPALVPAFGRGGVLVNEVVEEGPAYAAGIQPGDVLVAIDDTEVNSADAAARALGSIEVGGATRLRVRRSGSLMEVTVRPASAYEIAGLARGRAGEPAAGVDARAVLSPEALDQAGIPVSARVLSIGDRAVTSRVQAERLLRNARAPVPVLVKEGSSRFFAAVEPSR